jgi:cyclopropane-fatty-acyl-phospholipid synthase
MMTAQLMPDFSKVQAHYDLSNEFFRLFLDPSWTYSCAYFERADMTLEQAQTAKIDLALSKLALEPGMTLLDIGCGWGSVMKRAVEQYDVNVVGLTLSHNQAARVEKVFGDMDTRRSRRVLLGGWETFDEPVDRIVSIAAFEHFGRERYPRFFEMAHRLLPSDGVMLLHTIIRPTIRELRRRGLRLTHEVAELADFLRTEIFPGTWLPTVPIVDEHATEAGFTVSRVHALQLHYAKTLGIWAAALQANKDDAIAIQSEEVYERYMKYLTGCAWLFRDGYTDVDQFTLKK